MSAFSDLAFQAAMAAYIVALVCYGIELASRRAQVPTALEAVSAGRRSGAPGDTMLLTDPADRPDEVLNDAGARFAAAGPDPAADADVDDDGPTRPLLPWGVRFGRAAVLVTVVGLLANLASVVSRGLAAGRLPLGNMYEFTSGFCCIAVGCWLVVLIKTGARPLGLFVMSPVVILAFLAGTVLWVPAGPVVPSLNSYWKWIHVTTVSASGSVLLVSGAASAMYLLRHRYDRRLSAAGDVTADSLRSKDSLRLEEALRLEQALGLRESVWSKLPSLPVLDKIAYRTAIVAFPVYTFAIIAGALWAEAAWGRYWGWDPKETVAFVSWVFYAGYLHARATSGWRGVRSAWVNVLGFAAIVFNLFFVNMVVTGLHSYAGLG